MNCIYFIVNYVNNYVIAYFIGAARNEKNKLTKTVYLFSIA